MAVLTAARRHALPASDFAGSAKKESYPIDTTNRARNALARVSQFGSPELKAKVRSKVHAKFPGIKQHDERMKMDGGKVAHRMDRAARKG
jgi:hypothetical protein